MGLMELLNGMRNGARRLLGSTGTGDGTSRIAPALLALLAAASLVGGYSFAFAQVLTPQQYHKKVGPRACPDDKDKAGRKCGKRAAFCDPGGVQVTGCFRVDVERRKKAACG